MSAQVNCDGPHLDHLPLHVLCAEGIMHAKDLKSRFIQLARWLDIRLGGICSMMSFHFDILQFHLTPNNLPPDLDKPDDRPSAFTK